MTRRRWWQGLFARVTLAYAISSLLLSLIVALASYTIAQNRLLSVEENRARDQFFFNALGVRRGVEGIPDEADDETKVQLYGNIIDDVRRTDTSGHRIVGSGIEAGGLTQADIPADLEQQLLLDPIVQHRFRGPDATRLALGINLEQLGVKYYEVFTLAPIESTLGDLRLILLAVSTGAGLAGAGLGYYSARRALAPVGRISSAAQAIAGGDFETRLDLQTDPDLAVLSQSFNEMVDALSTRIERDERFASDVSHELRSPLMTLTASIEILERRKASLPEVAQKAVTLLRDDLTRFESLVEDLLEISRMDAGAVELQSSSFELAEFLINVIAQSRSPEIMLDHPDRDRDLIVHADKRRLAQVVTNLIDNAAKYAGGATGISFRQIGDCAQIVVEDRGPGVPPGDRKQIFERFSRAATDAGRRGGGDSGVGLGLSLVAEHIRLHGGRVWVTDRVDGHEGARFVVELPVGILDEEPVEMAV
ncbi:MAG: HAMP domain-containing sensor histidine kinase [Actinomycetota bacterium]